MKRVFSFFYLLCVLAPLLDQEAAGWGRGVKAAETCAMVTAYAPARPASLVLPTFQRPHVIAHRGACGYLPEHTLQAYRLAIDLGVEYIEPDLVLTKDGHLICRHDVDLSETTDVSHRPEFADRRRNITFASGVAPRDAITGETPLVSVQGFFSFDFTLAEIKTLRAKQRLSQRSSTYNGLFQVPTFDEVIDMVREAEGTMERKVGIYAEVKEPHFFHLNGFDIESKVVQVLESKDLGMRPLSPSRLPPGPEDPAPLVIQCFDPSTLRSLAHRIPHVPLVQLLLSPLSKEHPSVGEGVSHHLGREAMYGDVPLSEIATYASGIGPAKSVFTSMKPAAARAVVDAAHELDLAVHPWTFRREAMYVDRTFESNSDEELRFFYECLNVDALFVEFPDQASMVIERMLNDDSDDTGVVAAAAAAAAAAGSDVATPSNSDDLGTGAASSIAVKTTAPFPSRRGRNNRSNRSSSTATQHAPLFTPTSPSTSCSSDSATTTSTSTTEVEGGAAGVAPTATSASSSSSSSSSAAAAATAPAGPSAGSMVAMLFSAWMGGRGESSAWRQEVGGVESVSETNMQGRHTGACSVDGVGGGLYRLPSNVLPWFKRKSY